MALTTDILVNFQGVDNVSNIAQRIGADINGTSSQTGGLMNTVSRLGGIFRGLNGLVMGVFGAYGLSTFKNITYGTATAREQILQLYESVAGSTKKAGPALDLWNKMDELTNHGYVSLDQLGQSINVLGMSAQATVPQMDSMVTLINEVGNRAILMGYDANRTQLLMNNVATGLNGNMQMLNNAFGVTKNKLKDLGWSGAATDIEGYNKALRTYLGISDDTGEHLDNTQGKVIALQKKFRIAGRKLGMYMLPPINAIMDAFTNLNEKSDDLMVSLIIIGTGFMSGFASILPTLAPLIQVWQFLQTLNIPTIGLGNLTQTNTIIGRLLANTKDLVATPIAGWLRIWKNTNILPIIDKMRAGILRFYLTNIRYTGTMVELTRHTSNFSSTIMNGLGKVSGGIGNAQIKLAQFVGTYGSLEGRANVLARIIQNSSRLEMVGDHAQSNIYKYGQLGKKATGFLERRDATTDKKGFVDHLVRKEMIARKLNRKAIDEERIANQKNVLGKIASALWTGEETARLGANTTAKAVSKGASIAEGVARADANTQVAVGNMLRLYEMGIIDKVTLARVLYRLGIIDEAAAKKLANVASLEELGVKSLLSGINLTLIAENAILIAQILLVIGVVVGLILVIDQIGKTLGWWDNWKTMLDAIVNGLKRLWSAFINNPNVQGFIKDIQGLFGQLGSIITQVAWAVLQFFGWEDDGSEVDLVRMIIDVFGALGKALGDVVNSFKAVFGTIWSIVGPPAMLVWEALKSIVCILIGCSPGIVPALQNVYQAFVNVFRGLAGFMQGPADIIRTTIGTIISIIQLAISTIGQAFNIIGGIITGKVSLSDGLKQLVTLAGTYLTQLGNIFRNHFTRIIGIVINSAKRLVSGFIGNITGFPGRVLQILMGLINNIMNLPQQMAQGAMNLAGGLEEGFLNGVRDWIPGASILLGPKTNNYGAGAAKTIGNVNKSYTNTTQKRQGHTFNIGAGAIQLDARNLTTKESKQVMINALEGLTTYETVHTKKAQAGK